MPFKIYLHLIFVFIIASRFTWISLSPSTGYAQDSIRELEQNVNASGLTHRGQGTRIFGEAGMGLIGEAAAVGIGFGVYVLATEKFNAQWGAVWSGIIAAEVLATPLAAGGTYFGGWLSGGRAKPGPVFAGAYIGAAPGLILMGVGALTSDACLIIGAIAVPVFSLIGSIVGYEISESKETDRLKSERDKWMQMPSQRSRPVMINLFSGRF